MPSFSLCRCSLPPGLRLVVAHMEGPRWKKKTQLGFLCVLEKHGEWSSSTRDQPTQRNSRTSMLRVTRVKDGSASGGNKRNSRFSFESALSNNISFSLKCVHCVGVRLCPLRVLTPENIAAAQNESCVYFFHRGLTFLQHMFVLVSVRLGVSLAADCFVSSLLFCFVVWFLPIVASLDTSESGDTLVLLSFQKFLGSSISFQTKIKPVL